MYITMNNPSAHPSYSHYYLLSPSTLFFLFLYILLFFAHLVVFLHILLFFAHLIVLHFFYFIAHFTLISPFLTICMPLCYVTLYNLYSYYFALSTERTWFDCISLLIIPCITIKWQIKKPWPWPWPWKNRLRYRLGSTFQGFKERHWARLWRALLDSKHRHWAWLGSGRWRSRHWSWIGQWRLLERSCGWENWLRSIGLCGDNSGMLRNGLHGHCRKIGLFEPDLCDQDVGSGLLDNSFNGHDKVSCLLGVDLHGHSWGIWLLWAGIGDWGRNSLREYKLTDSIAFCDHDMTGWQHRYGLLGCSKQIRTLRTGLRVWNQDRLGGYGTTDMTGLLGRDRINRWFR